MISPSAFVKKGFRFEQLVTWLPLPLPGWACHNLSALKFADLIKLWQLKQIS